MFFLFPAGSKECIFPVASVQTSRHKNKLPSSIQKFHKNLMTFIIVYTGARGTCQTWTKWNSWCHRSWPSASWPTFWGTGCTSHPARWVYSLTLSQLAIILRNRLHLTPSQVSELPDPQSAGHHSEEQAAPHTQPGECTPWPTVS